MTKRISVSKNVYDKIFQVTVALQEEHPTKPVTQKEVLAKIKKQAFSKPSERRLSPRHVRRTLRNLLEDNRIIKYGRGQYWLPENLEMNVKFLRKQLELEKSFRERVENDIWTKRVVELERKLHEQEQFYENILEQYERKEILRELEKKDSNR